SVNMDFVYGASFMVDAPDAYETLILDALRGDATLFTRQDEVEQQWRFVDLIARAWSEGHGDLPLYPAGTSGPAEADLLIGREGTAPGLQMHCRQSQPGGREQVSCEHILIRARGDVDDRIASAVIPLLLPDLPVFLWWTGTPPLDAPHFEELVGLADRLIVD